MKSPVVFVAFLLATISWSCADAHSIPWWGYDNMFGMSEFVVIAQATSNTHDTSERTALRDCTPPMRVIGVVTDFESLYVLKGPKLKRFTVHHYREAPVHLKENEVYFQDCADFVTFKSHVATQPFLLFLIRERDGRFAPVGGQTDPKMSMQKIYEP